MMSKNQFGVMAIIAFSSVLLFSCSNPRDHSNESKVDFQSFKELKFSQLLSENQFAIKPLETGEQFLMGDFNLLRFNGTDYYIFSESDGRVYRFMADGTFLNTIGEIGDAPGEYYNPLTFSIKENHIFILTSSGSTSFLYEFTENGDFVGRREFNESTYTDFEFYNDDVLFSTGSNTVLGNKFRLHFRKLETEEYSEAFPFEPKNLYSFQEKNLHISVGSIYYTESFLNDTYLVSKDSISKTYSFDFGEFNLDEDATTGADKLVNFERILEEGVGLIRSYFETDRWVYFNIMIQKNEFGAKFYHLFKNKISEEYALYEGLSGRAPAFNFINNNTIVFLIHAGDLIPFYKENAQVFGASSQQLDQLKLTDNPLIIEVSLK